MTQSPPTPPQPPPASGAGSQPPPPPPPPAAPPPPPPASPVAPPVSGPPFDLNAITSRLNQAELALAGGALIIVVLELLFGLLLNDYRVGQLPIVLAAGILALIWMQKTGRSQLSSYTGLLVAAGAALGLMGVVALLGDLRSAVTFVPDLVTWLGRLSFYAGCLLAGFGAYALWRSTRPFRA